MALDVLSQDITVDDPPGLTDDAPHSADTALQYLLSRHGPGGLTSPELARQADLKATASAAETIPPSRPHPLGWVQ